MGRNVERRLIAASRVAPRPSGVSVRDRLKGLTAADEAVLRLVGGHLGALAARDLKVRCADGLEHRTGRWAERKREPKRVAERVGNAVPEHIQHRSGCAR